MPYVKAIIIYIIEIIECFNITVRSRVSNNSDGLHLVIDRGIYLNGKKISN